jgi:hypothetical protein
LATNRGKKKTFLSKKSDASAGATGPMAFGQRRGTWKNPTKSKLSRMGSSDSSHPNVYTDEESSATNALDAAELCEIISSESFRLSRDGIIQQHYTLMQQKSAAPGGVASPRGSDINETVRYYKECASRPKGYRRLVVSSMIPSQNSKIPPPPVKTQSTVFSKSSKGLGDVLDQAPSKKDGDDDSFDKVEYRYIGPPNVSSASFVFIS